MRNLLVFNRVTNSSDFYFVDNSCYKNRGLDLKILIDIFICLIRREYEWVGKNFKKGIG